MKVYDEDDRLGHKSYQLRGMIAKLRTLRPEDGKIVLPVKPAEAERLWYIEVSYQDRKDVELFVEPHGVEWCLVSVQLWEDSDYLAGGEMPIVPWLIFGSVALCLLILVAQGIV